MTIDINELRRLALDGDLAAMQEIILRLKAAETDAAHQKALAESALRVAEGWERTCCTLRAKIEQIERQEPVGYGVLYVEPATGEEDWDSIWKYQEFAEDHIKDFTQAYADIGEPVGEITTVPLYALPGAQPAPSAPDVDALAQFIREIDGAHQLGAGVLAERIVEWLAAPEAKP
ncbi:MAG: hypothetical protein H6926_09095 [Chromatiales bacterium]|nr:hypothetical protein [Chromatiales bacterium]